MSSSSMQQRPRHSAHGRPQPSRRPKSWLQPTEEWTFAELDTEIQRFVRHISLTPQERTQREQAVEHVRALCSKCLPHCTVVVVGSFAFDLGLPSSDVDLSLQGVEGDPAVALQHLEEALRASGDVADVELILARVPVLKVSFQSGVQVDVNASFSSSLIDTITRVRHFVTVHPQARAIILLTKCLLRQWGLANVFAGGLSSTSVYLLVERFFALKDKASHAGESGDLSRLVAPDASPCLTPRSESSWGPTASEESHTSSSDRVAPMTSTLFVDFLEHCSSEWYMYGFKLFDPSDATNEVSRGTKRVLEIQALMAHTRSSLLVVTKGFKPQGAPVSQLSAVVADPRASQRASNPATTSIRVGNKFVRN